MSVDTVSGYVPPQKQETELLDKRTSNRDVFVQKDGTIKTRQYWDNVNFKKNGKWEKIDTTLVEDTNATGGAASGVIGKIKSIVNSKQTTFRIKENDWQARFAPSDAKQGMLRIQVDGQTVTFRPVNASKVNPIKISENGKEVVRYKDLWPGVDLDYMVMNSSLKEFVYIKSKTSITDYSFKVEGVELEPDPDNPGGFIQKNGKGLISPLSVAAGQRGVVSEPIISQKWESGELKVSLDKNWLQKQEQSSFPIVIDPTYVARRVSGNRASGNYIGYKSDGYVCPSTSCYINAGTLNDAGVWKTWRAGLHFQYSDLVQNGRVITQASMRLRKMTPPPYIWFGNDDTRWFGVSHMACWSYDCINWNAPRHSAPMGPDAWLDVTALYQNRVAAGDMGAWLMINGEEGAYTNFRSFDPEQTWVDFYTSGAPGEANPVSPNQNEVVTTIQPTLTGSPALDPDNDPITYSFWICEDAGCNSPLAGAGDLTYQIGQSQMACSKTARPTTGGPGRETAGVAGGLAPTSDHSRLT